MFLILFKSLKEESVTNARHAIRKLANKIDELQKMRVDIKKEFDKLFESRNKEVCSNEP